MYILQSNYLWDPLFAFDTRSRLWLVYRELVYLRKDRSYGNQTKTALNGEHRTE